MSYQHPEDFSFDTFPGLDAELDAAYAQQASVDQWQTTNEGLAEVSRSVRSSTESPEVKHWALRQLPMAILSWENYAGWGIDTPQDVFTDTGDFSPDLVGKLTHLYEAQEALRRLPEYTPSGEQIGDAMSLVLIPWEAIRTKLQTDGFSDWVNSLRAWQGYTEDDEGKISERMSFCKSINERIYRQPNLPTSDLLTMDDYLDYKIASDGPWGMMLMQTSIDAGSTATINKSPDQLTQDGTQPLEIGGYDVGSMGIIEWLAFTLQENPGAVAKRQ